MFKYVYIFQVCSFDLYLKLFKHEKNPREAQKDLKNHHCLYFKELGPSSQCSLKAGQGFWGHFWPPWAFFHDHRGAKRNIIVFFYDLLNSP